MAISKYLKLEYVTARTLYATLTINDYNVVKFEKDVIEININNEPILQLMEEVPCVYSGVQYKFIANNIIENTEERSFLIQESIINSTNYYVVPYVMPNREFCQWDKLLYNSYLSDDGSRLFMVYRYGKSAIYQRLEERMSKSENFVKVHDYDEFVVFEMSIPPKYDESVQLYMNGAYSKMKFRNMLIKFCPAGQVSKMRDVLTKAPRRKKMLEKQLSTPVSEVFLGDSELASIPKDFIYYNHFMSNVLKQHEKL